MLLYVICWAGKVFIGKKGNTAEAPNQHPFMETLVKIQPAELARSVRL